jgi:signal transduction histidine kinase
VSPRRRGEGGVAASDRDHIRRSFLGLALCHELKQPLHSLNLNLELLTKRLGKAGNGEGAADISGPMGALGRVVDRINDCLDAFASRSMPDGVSPATRPLMPILEDAVERARDRAKRAGVQIFLRASELPEVPVNSDQIAVAVDALIDNAIRATKAGGEVLISAVHSEDDVRIEVTDRGTGMTPDVAKHAVEIGYSTWGGSGIGLTVAKFITYHHAGGFQVATTPGQGTTVAMILPVSDLRE